MIFRDDNSEAKCGIGLRFRKCDSTSEYILADCGNQGGVGPGIALINLVTGMRWTAVVTVQCAGYLTRQEWEKVTAGGSFVEIE